MSPTTFLILCAVVVALAGMFILAVVAVSLCRAAGRTFPTPPPSRWAVSPRTDHYTSPTARHGEI